VRPQPQNRYSLASILTKLRPTIPIPKQPGISTPNWVPHIDYTISLCNVAPGFSDEKQPQCRSMTMTMRQWTMSIDRLVTKEKTAAPPQPRNYAGGMLTPSPPRFLLSLPLVRNRDWNS
jgi:hypothetical protein